MAIIRDKEKILKKKKRKALYILVLMYKMIPPLKCPPTENLKKLYHTYMGKLHNYRNDFQRIFNGLGKCL